MIAIGLCTALILVSLVLNFCVVLNNFIVTYKCLNLWLIQNVYRNDIPVNVVKLYYEYEYRHVLTYTHKCR